MSKVRRLGILTAGGDCPGLNAVIRAVVKSALRRDPPIEVIGILDGYAGLVLSRIKPLSDGDVSGILPRGGTILGTSNRDNPFKFVATPGATPVDRSADAVATVERERLDGLLTVGGDGTLQGALALSERGIPVIGIPKTIDNDLSGTDVTFGFDTAVSIATDAVDRLHTTAESHHRILICEVMGRNAGWIALRAGIAGGGDIILIPEIPYNIHKVVNAIEARERRGKGFSIIVVAEGAAPQGGVAIAQGSYQGPDRRPRLGGVSHVIAQELERMTQDEARVVILGHLQRGGTPTAFDRWLGTELGVHAVEAAAEGRWGMMTALHGDRVELVSIADATREPRRVKPENHEVRTARAVGTSFGD